MLVLAYLCVYLSAWIYVSVYQNQSYCIGKECKKNCTLRAKNMYQCMTVSAYKYMLVLAYLYVYLSVWIYVSVFHNQSYFIGNECKKKCILRAKNVYQWMTVSAYKSVLVLTFLCVYVSVFGADRTGLLGKPPAAQLFVSLQEPVAVLASYVPHTQTPVWSNTSGVIHNFYFVQVTIMGKLAVKT